MLTSDVGLYLTSPTRLFHVKSIVLLICLLCIHSISLVSEVTAWPNWKAGF